MHIPWRIMVHGFEVKALQDIQSIEQQKSLRVRCALIYVITLVWSVHGLRFFGMEVGQVFITEYTARLLIRISRPAGDLASVKRLRAIAHYCLQAESKIGLRKQLACPWRAAFGKECSG